LGSSSKVWPALRLEWPTASESPRDLLAAAIDGRGAIAVEDDGDSAQIVYFADDAQRDEAVAALDADWGRRGVALSRMEVPDGDWAARTQRDLPAVRIGNLIVAPPWDLPAPSAAARLVIVIEPSMGFGTGHHQSTRLCLSVLQSIDVRGLTALDLGTGSGVLAIAAALLGAARAIGVDVDRDAAAAARENVVRNGVGDRVEIVSSDLTAFASAAADLTLANLTGGHLARWAVAIIGHTRPGGRLVLSGYTEEEAPGVHAGFASRADLERCFTEDAWCASLWRLRHAPTAPASPPT
jgi:ribosomal protein L11 methyltransferase